MIKKRIYKVISNRYPGSVLNDNSRFVEDLEMDSLAILEFVMDLEDEFQINIPEDRIKLVKTIGDIVTILQNWSEHATDTAD